MIKLENISKKFGEKIVFDGFSYVFPDRGFVAITGKSGVGKTTLLRMIMGLETPDSGEVRFCTVGGMPEKSCVKISAVFQEDRLLEQDTVLENILFVMDGKKENKERNIKKAKEILAGLGLEKETNGLAVNLSGGMKRRVAVARCLAVDADVYIMDEPTKGLDDDLREITLELIHGMTDKRGRLLIMVTHERDEARGFNDIIDFNSIT